MDETVLQQKPNINAVATLEKVIEIQSVWGQAEGLRVCQGGGAYGYSRAGDVLYIWEFLP